MTSGHSGMAEVFELKGVTGGKDRRGFSSLTFTFLALGVSADDALTVSLPNVTKLPEVSRSITEWDAGKDNFYLDVTYEGSFGEPTEEQTQYSLDAEWREEPIESFPHLDLLKEQYGGVLGSDGKMVFPERLEGVQGGSGRQANKGAATDKNPLFGVTTYPVQRFVASMSYVTRKPSKSIYTRVGRVVNSLPGNWVDPPETKWIVCPPKVRKRGDVWEVVEIFKSLDSTVHLESLYLLLDR